MVKTTAPVMEGRKAGRVERYAWAAIPLLAAAIAVLAFVRVEATYAPPYLLLVLNAVFVTAVSLLVSGLAANSYLAQRSLPILLLGCGTLVLATGAIVAGLQSDANSAVTVFDTSACLAGMCHLAGTWLAGRGLGRMRSGWPVLVALYAVSVAVVFLLLSAVEHQVLPVFFISGQGATLRELLVLWTAGGMFALSAWLLLRHHRHGGTVFAYWYGLGLALLAVGLVGVSMQTTIGSPLNWTALAAQYVGGVYLFVATMVAVRTSGAWVVSLDAAGWNERFLRLVAPQGIQSLPAIWRYGLALVAVAAMVALRWALVPVLGTMTPYVTVFPTMVIVAVVFGTGPGLVGTALGIALVESYLVEPAGHVALNLGLAVRGAIMMLSSLCVGRVGDGLRAERQCAEHEATAARRAEEALRKSEARMRAVFGALAEGIIFIDRECRVQEVNEAAERMGFTRQFLTHPGSDPRFSIVRSDGKPLPVEEQPAVVAVRTGQLVCDVEMGVPNANGELKWVLESAQPVRDESGEVVGAVASFFDLTERKRTEEALRESEERFRVAQELSPDGFLIFRPLRDSRGVVNDFLWIYENDAAARMNDTNPKEVCGKRVSAVLPQHEKSPFHKAYKEAAETGEVRVVEEAVYDQDTFRERRWFRVAAVPTTGGDVAILVQNVTERKKSEEALRESEERLRLAQQVARVGSFEWDLERKVTRWSPELEALYGVPPGTIGGRYEEWAARVHPDDLPAVERCLRESMGMGLFETEWRILWPDGSIRWVAARGQVFKDDAGKPVRMVGVNLDITARKQGEQNLEEAQRLAHIGSWHWDARTDVTTGSEELLRIYGFNPEKETMPDFQQQRGRCYPVEEWERLNAAVQRTLQTGAGYELDVRAIRNGSGIWVITRSEVVRDSEGRIIGLRGTVQDITERKRAEEALRAHAARLAAVLDAQREIAGAKVDYVALRQLILERMARLLAAEGATLEIAQGGEMVIEAGTGPWVKFVGLRLKTAGSLTGLCMTSNRILRADDTETDPRVDREANRRAGLRSMIAMPLRYDERSFGVLKLLSPRIAAFTADAEETLRMMNDFLSVTLARQRAQEALEQSERLYRGIGESIDYGIWICDAQGRNIYASESLLKLVGITQEQCKDFGWGSVLHPDDAKATMEAWTQCVQTGGPWYREHRYLGVDGQYHPILACGVAVRDERGQITHWAGINLDISRLKQAEEVTRSSLREKEVLLKEIHHRVKNNMQVISSLVDLQADALGNSTVREPFAEIRDRVRSMALVHEQLYQSESLAQVNFATYTESLLNHLWHSYGSLLEGVALKLDLQPITLPIDMGVPCGLLLSELATNALKHAFRDRSGGELSIRLYRRPDARFCLTVSDNGVGLPSGLDWRKARSMGLQLVRMLIKQLKADLEVTTSGGTRFEVVFAPPQPRTERP